MMKVGGGPTQGLPGDGGPGGRHTMVGKPLYTNNYPSIYQAAVGSIISHIPPPSESGELILSFHDFSGH